MTTSVMRLVLSAAALLLATAYSAAAQEPPSCERTVKETANETTITCDNQSVTVLKQPNQQISYAMVALSRSGEPSHALSIVTGSASSQFATVDSATVLIDDEGHPVEASYTNGEAQAGVAIEQVVVIIPAAYAEMIREANTLWLRINGAVFDLEPTIAQMRRIHDLWPSDASTR